MSHSLPPRPLLLLIEGEEDYAVLFQRIFAKIARRWRIVCVPQASEAIYHMVRNEFPDLLVTNLVTSRMTGQEVITWIRHIKCPKEVSILIFDHAWSSQQERELGDLAVTNYLSKSAPFDRYRTVLQQLVRSIESQLVKLPLLETTPLRAPGFFRSFS